MNKKNQADNSIKSFEQSLKELETIVSAMQSMDLPLDKSLELFEKGVTLANSCQTALQAAEQKVAVITEKAGIIEEKEFYPDSENEE